MVKIVGLAVSGLAKSVKRPELRSLKEVATELT